VVAAVIVPEDPGHGKLGFFQSALKGALQRLDVVVANSGAPPARSRTVTVADRVVGSQQHLVKRRWAAGN
jgi:hypothetical protein